MSKQKTLKLTNKENLKKKAEKEINAFNETTRDFLSTMRKQDKVLIPMAEK